MISMFCCKDFSSVPWSTPIGKLFLPRRQQPLCGRPCHLMVPQRKIWDCSPGTSGTSFKGCHQSLSWRLLELGIVSQECTYRMLAGFMQVQSYIFRLGTQSDDHHCRGSWATGDLLKAPKGAKTHIIALQFHGSHGSSHTHLFFFS